MTDWEDIQPDFRKAVLSEIREGKTMEQVAEDLPADRVTVWRLMNGGVQRPAKATVVAAERFTERVLHLQPPSADAAEG